MNVALIHHQLKLRGGMEAYLFSLIEELHRQRIDSTAFFYQKSKADSLPCSGKRFFLNWLPRKWRKFVFGYHIHRHPAVRKHTLSISCMRAIHQDILICGGTHLGYLHHAKKTARRIDRLEIVLEKKSYETAKVIVAHSDLLEAELRELYNVPSNKIVKLYPPISTQFHQMDHSKKIALREKYKIPLNKTALLFPSTGHKRKGFELLQAALKLLPTDDYVLVVAGNKPKEVEISNCHYLGFVTEMSDLYNACDITVLPSFYEPFGLVTIESLQCGTPVIISEFVGAKSLVTNQEGIVLSALTPQEIADAIVKLRMQPLIIPPDFVLRKNLSITAHVENLLRFGSSLPHP